MGKISRFRVGSHRRRVNAILCLALFLVVLSPEQAFAENRVDVDVAHAGNPFRTMDTLYIGGEYQFRLRIENDVELYGMTMIFDIVTTGNFTFSYSPQPDGIGNGDMVTVVPGSRLDPPNEVFDLGGLMVMTDEWDGRKFIGVGGASLNEGLPPGPFEEMIRIHFTLNSSYNPDIIGTICFDTTAYGCACPDFVFNGFIHPATNLPRCWPVKMRCGDPTGDGAVNVADVAFMVNYIFRGGPAPYPLQLGDANSDGELNVGDIMFLLKAAFRFGPQPECPP